jgi:hypothetical protein
MMQSSEIIEISIKQETIMSEISDEFPVTKRSVDGSLKVYIYPPDECVSCSVVGRDVYYREVFTNHSLYYRSGMTAQFEQMKLCDKCHIGKTQYIWG